MHCRDFHSHQHNLGVSAQVESLTMSRQSSMRGNEPSDAMRVVNALLTQLDQIKQLPNVLVREIATTKSSRL